MVAARSGGVDDLVAAERALMPRAAASRRQEFAAGRWCAHRALEQAGHPAAAVLRGPLGEPLWPRGFAGSITHDGGIAVAAAHRLGAALHHLRLGIDLLDRSDPASFTEIAAVVLSGRDRDAMGNRAETPLAIAEAFSAKEAAVKILSVTLGTFMELTELRLEAARDGWLVVHRDLDIRVSTRAAQIDAFLATVAVGFVTPQ